MFSRMRWVLYRPGAVGGRCGLHAEQGLYTAQRMPGTSMDQRERRRAILVDSKTLHAVRRCRPTIQLCPSDDVAHYLMLSIVSDTYKASSAPSSASSVARGHRSRAWTPLLSVGEGCGVSRSLSAPALLLLRRGCEREHGCLRLLSALLGAIGASATTLAPCPSATGSIVVYVHTALTRAAYSSGAAPFHWTSPSARAAAVRCL
ncbi:hypothetical protein C8R46DRAFT_426954 [Mycena filopes]|nr:hypothetical protein C8R46DRAFT_426954 [Mycena filopes]